MSRRMNGEQALTCEVGGLLTSFTFVCSLAFAVEHFYVSILALLKMVSSFTQSLVRQNNP